MESKDFVDLKRQEPFRPFRVKTTDGRELDVVHPQLVMVRKTYLWIGIPRPGYDLPIFERLANVNYSDITEVELLDADKALKAR